MNQERLLLCLPLSEMQREVALLSGNRWTKEKRAGGSDGFVPVKGG